MIKEIIKRDGRVEPFIPSKVNGWGEWASRHLGGGVDWSSVVIEAVNRSPQTCTTRQLQQNLIDVCIARKTWEYNRMAGRLYADLMRKEIYGNGEYPTVKWVHEQLHEAGIMIKLDYSDEEYAEVETFINHKLDLTYPHYQLNQLRFKYALRDKVNRREFETPQFVYMRMAMVLSEKEPALVRMQTVRMFYKLFSENKINVPTPYFTNLGTKNRNYASCCLYTTLDTAKSLATGDYIANLMTCAGAGIGTHLKTRSLGDPVRGGVIAHQGKVPYIRSMTGAIAANLQNGRGGASTVHYTCFDPEVETLQILRHPTTPQSIRVAGCHYSFGSNKLFARRVARNETFTPFSYYGNEDMYEAMYSDPAKFEQMYAEYERRVEGKVKRLNARDVLLGALTQAYETGVHYLHFIDAMNEHTPFREPIYQSNLCQEINLPTKGYSSVEYLYDESADDGEIGLCTLAGIVVSNIESDEEYAQAAYYALKMIDYSIMNSEYPFPNLRKTAQSRMSAGVGIIGLAHLMAKKGLRYDTQEGRDFVHELCETHYWHLLRASLRLGKELGNAPWIDRTRWVDGWLPIDTYNRNVDSLVTVGLKRNWEGLRIEIIANGGIRNSVLVAHMPAESSSIGSGTTNGLYPIRDTYIVKTNDTQVNHWAAPDGTKLSHKYQRAWDIAPKDMIKFYAVVQKWTDQGISADLFVDLRGGRKVTSAEMIETYLDMVRYGLKSRYYVNSNTSDGVRLMSDASQHGAVTDATTVEDTEHCESCTL